ncbi:aromatase/cyclase [Streptomyces atratus]|uniref:aromatase/cyclase n=1 Tax=Streptomyces atratus TaxID=1893 RepID=UPI0022552DDB|nr:SRPBCC family protein [Streptomyces atratus]MCX5339773.1 SRPBCC family protein [Streptomyces atratus]
MTDRPRVDVHTTVIDSSADEVYHSLEDVGQWSQMFEPTIHSAELARDKNKQTIQLWAIANGEPKSWVSERQLDPVARTIRFAQTVTAPPVAEMSGEWQVLPLSEHSCSVQLSHTYRAEDGSAESLDWIARAVDTNSTKELAALRFAVERDADSELSPFTFTDSVDTTADPVLLFSFLDRGELWSGRLDHVAEAEMKEFPDGLQLLRMRTRTPDGDTHVTESYRVSQSPARILYKQVTLPALLALHTGTWTIAPAGESWQVTSEHTVAINPEAVQKVLGPSATLSDAKQLARRNLGNNSLRTLEAAVRWAGTAVPRR